MNMQDWLDNTSAEQAAEAVSCQLIWQSGYEMRRAEVERRGLRFGEDLDAAIVAAVKEEER